MKISTKIDQYYQVSDEWYPNYHNNLVRMRVSFYEYDNSEKDMVRISFWGADDFGVEKDELVSKKIFYKKIKEIKNWLKVMPNPLNANYLFNQGFIKA